MILDQFFYRKRLSNPKAVLNKSNDSPFRSIIKSISWRIIGTIDTIIISWFITETLSLALSIGAVELVSKMILYFFHERIWNLIKWGA